MDSGSKKSKLALSHYKDYLGAAGPRYGESMLGARSKTIVLLDGHEKEMTELSGSKANTCMVSSHIM